MWKFRSQTSDLWTDGATVVRRVREEKESEENKLEKRESGKRRSLREKEEKS
jgi:hypothetical protein